LTDALLRVEGLTKTFGALRATHNFSFDVTRGEIHALIGPNGAGKTTVINQLSGELKPDRGRIRFDGYDITGLPAYKRAQLGLTRSYQITSVFERLTVKENLLLALQAHCGHSFRFWHKADADPALCEPLTPALARVGLEHRAHISAGSLSHGEKRQLEVGMALAGEPKLLLLDEPMAGMGPGGTVELSKLIRKIKETTAILLVEHDMSVVFSLAQRITVIVYGEALLTGTPRQVRANAAVRRAYLGEESD
jgi:branched-chain amino acid transport system ATP-binding protein